MKITQTLNLPAHYFYTVMLDSAIYDIKQQTGKTLSYDQLLDYHYEKPAGNHKPMVVTISELVDDQLYQYEGQSDQGHFKASYQIKPLAKDQISVIYEENMTQNTQHTGYLMATVMGFFRKRSFKKMLKQIEQNYVKKQLYSEHF